MRILEELEIKCICGHKKGWHHAKPNKKNPSVCYGIGCPCVLFRTINTIFFHSLIKQKIRSSLPNLYLPIRLDSTEVR